MIRPDSPPAKTRPQIFRGSGGDGADLRPVSGLGRRPARAAAAPARGDRASPALFLGDVGVGQKIRGLALAGGMGRHPVMRFRGAAPGGAASPQPSAFPPLFAVAFRSCAAGRPDGPCPASGPASPRIDARPVLAGKSRRPERERPADRARSLTGSRGQVTFGGRPFPPGLPPGVACLPGRFRRREAPDPSCRGAQVCD